MNNFDQWGWYTSDNNGREATEMPPITSETTTPGEDRANWTGKRWVVAPYVAPVENVPSVIVPESITPRQGELTLIEFNLYDAVKAYFDGLPGKDGAKARAEFYRAQEWRRDWPLLVDAAKTVFGLTDAQIDAMFVYGSAQ